MSKIYRVLLFCALLLSCGNKKTKERPLSPRIKKETKIVSPTFNQAFQIGKLIDFAIEPGNATIDSISLDINEKTDVCLANTFIFEIKPGKVGITPVKVTVYFDGKKETHHTKIIVLPNKQPETYTYEIVNTYPHDPDDYTQGFLAIDGYLYESTGRRGHSAIKKKNVVTGKTLQAKNLQDDLFGEGLAHLNDHFYQLTYTSGICFVYSTNFELLDRLRYTGEGWGLCEYDGNLLMTDGSERIYIRDPHAFSIIGELQVYDTDGKVERLNEVEVINGLIYANIYQTDFIIAIDPLTGVVVKKIDLTGLLPEKDRVQADVLNGIAYDPAAGRIFITGKYWPTIFEVKFVKKNIEANIQ